MFFQLFIYFAFYNTCICACKNIIFIKIFVINKNTYKKEFEEEDEEFNFEDFESGDENSFEDDYDQEGLAELLDYEIYCDEEITFKIDLAK